VKLIVLLLALASLVAVQVPAADAFTPKLWRAEMMKQINRYRVSHGLRPLKANAKLQRAAAAHSKGMARHHVLSHTSANGVSWERRIRYYGYRGSWIGENLAVGKWAPKTALRAWHRSSPHRANLLNGRFRAVGIGVRKGTFSGHIVYYITADFGGR